MSDYTEFFLNGNGGTVALDCFELTHPNFTTSHRLVRNAVNGVTVTHDGGSKVYRYCGMKLDFGGSRADLDNTLTITLGDVGEELQSELDSIAASDGFSTRPVINYRVYRSDVLSAPMYGPIKLEVTKVAYTVEGAALEASATSLNVSKTGEIYTLARFPMLRGFL